MTKILYQPGTSPAEIGLAPPEHRVERDGNMLIDRDIAVSLADGMRIFVDLYRPHGATNLPVIVSWGPYGKHLTGPSQYAHIPNEAGEGGGGVDPSWISSHTGFEAPDPVAWTEAGYAVISVNPRAMWWSEGDYATIWGEREARDVADVIEWAGTQAWSNSKVGMAGVSYLAIIQWWVASLRPRHLAAINPCEGLTDVYREFMFHGGIPDNGFPAFWQRNRLKFSTSKVEAIYDMTHEHPLDDEYWASKRPDLSKIEVPAFVIASWSDQGLHTRGTLDAFEQISSTEKYLLVHGRKKWGYYHQPSTFEQQRSFFDKFLKGEPGGAIETWPLARYELRTGYYRGIDRHSDIWPLPGRSLRAFHLDANDGRLVDDAPVDTGRIRYEAGEEGGQATFDHVFAERTDIVGSAALSIWLTADEAEDADIFVALQKLDATGAPIHFPFGNTLENGPVALGWLRASHRALDPGKSTPDRPWHPHKVEEPLVPGVPTKIDIEIWPSATRFEMGERLRLIVRGSDVYTKAMFSRHTQTRNRGVHVISTGGGFDSMLTVNVLTDNNGAETPR